MAFTSIEIIALVLIIFAAIKMLVLLVKPASWMNFARKIYSKPLVIQVISFILAGIVLYYLIGAGITIVEILAISAFVGLLIVVGLASEVDNIIKKYQTMIKQGKLWKRYWFYTLLWIALLVWGALVLFNVI
jgi:hypothetical protein